MTENLPQSPYKREEYYSNEFWRKRIINAIKEGCIEQAIWVAPDEEQCKMKNRFKIILDKYLGYHQHVIDIGCGIGILLDVTEIHLDRYLGVDLVKELLWIAQIYHPEYRFEARDGENLGDLPVRYDWAVIKGVLGSTLGYRGRESYDKLIQEGLRVADRILSISSDATEYQVITKFPSEQVIRSYND